MLYTGQRRSDVIRLGWQHVRHGKDGDKIAARQQKTDTPLLLPIAPLLACALEGRYAQRSRPPWLTANNVYERIV